MSAKRAKKLRKELKGMMARQGITEERMAAAVGARIDAGSRGRIMAEALLRKPWWVPPKMWARLVGYVLGAEPDQAPDPRA